MSLIRAHLHTQSHLFIKGSPHTGKCLPSDTSRPTYGGSSSRPAHGSSGLHQWLVLGGRTANDHLQESWIEKFLHKFIVHPINLNPSFLTCSGHDLINQSDESFDCIRSKQNKTLIKKLKYLFTCMSCDH